MAKGRRQILPLREEAEIPSDRQKETIRLTVQSLEHEQNTT